MLLTPHTMIGMAIGASISNIYIAVPLALLSHFAADLVPHYDLYDELIPTEKLKNDPHLVLSITDLLLGIGLGLYFTFHTYSITHSTYFALKIFLCGIAGVVPDMFFAPVVFWKSKNRFILGLLKIQNVFHNKTKPFWGSVTQIAATVAAFLVISSLLVR